MLYCRMAASSPPPADHDPLVQIRLSDLLALRARAAAPPVTPTGPPTPEPEFLTTREAAVILGVTPKGLEQMRAEGRGPRFVRVGRAVRYRRADLVRTVTPDQQT
jgi:excisionase family DNA binding protein